MSFSWNQHLLSLKSGSSIVGIVNVTPDSFSDGGQFLDPNKATAHALSLIEQGADILDIGGESSRPGASPVSQEEELSRVIPVISRLRQKTDIPLSIDTSKAAVAEAALQAGATIVNDITALRGDPKMAPLVAERGAGVILMHMRGTPTTMQQNLSYPNDDVVTSAIDFLTQARHSALAAGIAPDSILLDPGLGFGKTIAHNFSLLRALPALAKLGAPLMVGHSRKSFLKLAHCLPLSSLLASKKHPSLLPTSSDNYLAANLAITALARNSGVLFFRVHDPHPHRQALQATEALLFGGTE